MDSGIVNEERGANRETDGIRRILDDAEAQMEADNYDGALQILYFGLRSPEFDIRIYEKCAYALRMSGKHEAAELFEAVVAERDSAEPFFRLGYQLVQEGMYGSALGPLSRCVQLAPEAPAALYEFAFALMKEHYNEEALHFFLQAFQREQAMSIPFYIAQMLLFLGRPDEASRFVEKLEERVRASGEGEMQLDYLQGMLRRYRAHPPQTIRDWHFVQYGTLLLRTFEEDCPGEANPSNGRYTLVQFGYDQVAAVLAAFQTVVGKIDVFPKYEYIAAAGKASEPLVHALSQMMTLPVVSLQDGLASGRQGIVVASFSDELQEIAPVVWNRDDILLFSFAVSWTHESNVLPEVIGYLAQVPRLPWQERLEFGENGEANVIPADDRPAEEIARSILDRLPRTDMLWLRRIHDYYKQRQAEIVAGKRADVPRKRFFVHSALGGARY